MKALASWLSRDFSARLKSERRIRALASSSSQPDETAAWGPVTPEAMEFRKRQGLDSEGWQTRQTDSFRSRGGDRKGEKGLDQQARGDEWPTPRTISGGGESAERKQELGRTISGGGESAERKQELGRTISGGGDLQAAAEHWPTPAACSPNSLRGTGQNAEERLAAGHQINLQDAAASWPTPTASVTAGPNPSKARAAEGQGSVKLGGVAAAWPTPGANDFKGSAKPGQRRGQLDEAAEQRWPTPNAHDAEAGARSESAEASDRHDPTKPHDLQRAAEAWPTPTAGTKGPSGSATAGGGPTLSEVARSPSGPPDPKSGSDGRKSSRRAPISLPLFDTDQETADSGESQRGALWGTPTANHDAGSRNMKGSKAHAGTSLSDQVFTGSSTTGRKGNAARLNPLFVEWLMGWPEGWTDFTPLASIGSGPAGTAWSRWSRLMRIAFSRLASE